MIESIIHEIETNKKISFSKEASNQIATASTIVDSYKASYDIEGNTISIIINHSRSHLDKRTLNRKTPKIETIEWGVFLHHNIPNLDLTIHKNLWFRGFLYRKPFVRITCSEKEIKRALKTQTNLQRLYEIERSPLLNMIYNEGNIIRTYKKMHQAPIRSMYYVLLAFEQIATVLGQRIKTL